MSQQENPVSHLLWCLLIALRCAHDDTPFSSESARRKFIEHWLTGARKVPTFSGLAREFGSLRELLTKDKHMPIEGVLSALWEQSVLSDQCDFIRLRDAKNALNGNNWRSCTCRFPEEITPEVMKRAKTRQNHYLQLTRTEESFQATGQMSAPLTFQLILSKENTDFEQTFYLHGFAVMRGAEVALGRSILRTLYIGMSSLSENVWGAPPENLWRPQCH